MFRYRELQRGKEHNPLGLFFSQGRKLKPGLYASIGNVLHISGQAEIIDEVLRGFKDYGGLAPSGSTNRIEDLLAVSKLSLLASNVNETSDSQKPTEEQRLAGKGLSPVSLNVDETSEGGARTRTSEIS